MAEIIKLLISSIVTTLILIFLSVISIPVVTLRCAVSIIAALFRRDLRGMLKPGSAYFAHELFYHGKSPGMTLLTISEIEHEYAIERVQRQFEKLLNNTNLKRHQCYNKCRYRIVQFCGYSFWQIDNTFDIRKHIRSYAEVQAESIGTDWELPLEDFYTEAHIKLISSQLLSKPFSMDRSPWESILLPQPGSNLTFQFFRNHHCLCDGYSMVHLSDRLWDFEGTDVLAPAQKPRPWWHRAVVGITLPFKIYIDLVNFTANPPNDSHDWMQKCSESSPDSDKFLMTYSEAIPVDRIKALKNKFRVDFTSVVNSVSAGALAKMMSEMGTAVPSEVNIYVPFPMRGHRAGLRNHFTGALVTWYPGEPDALKRLRLSDASLAKTKSSTMPLVSRKFASFYALFPTFLIPALTAQNLGITAIFSPFKAYGGTGQMNSTNNCVRLRFVLTPFVDSGTACCFTALTSGGAVEFGFTVRRSVWGSASSELLDKFAVFVNQEMALLEGCMSLGAENNV